MREAAAGQVRLVGCVGHTHLIIRENRYLRWRCRDRHCEDAEKARATGQRAFHVFDLETRTIETEFEEAEGKRAA